MCHWRSSPPAAKSLRASLGVLASSAARLASQRAVPERVAVFCRSAVMVKKALALGVQAGRADQAAGPGGLAAGPARLRGLAFVARPVAALDGPGPHAGRRPRADRRLARGHALLKGPGGCRRAPRPEQSALLRHAPGWRPPRGGGERAPGQRTGGTLRRADDPPPPKRAAGRRGRPDATAAPIRRRSATARAGALRAGRLHPPPA